MLGFDSVELSVTVGNVSLSQKRFMTLKPKRIAERHLPLPSPRG